MSQEILPPSRGQLIAERTAIDPYRPPTLQPGSPIPSGRWWVRLDGRGDAPLWLNGQEYNWPRGTWFVLEDKYFHVLMETDLPMQWYDGYDLMEKTVGPTSRKIGSRRLTGGAPRYNLPSIPPCAG